MSDHPFTTEATKIIVTDLIDKCVDDVHRAISRNLEIIQASMDEEIDYAYAALALASSISREMLHQYGGMLYGIKAITKNEAENDVFIARVFSEMLKPKSIADAVIVARMAR